MDSKFSDDMKLEILSRTSLKTYDTMRCTSRDFEKLTYESYLLNLYNQRNRIVSGFLVQNLRNGCEYTNDFAPSHESNNLDLGLLPPNARVLATSEQGIMVFESPHPRVYGLVSYHVCKPATKQVLRLPNPKTKYLTNNVAMLVVASKPLHYKILKLSEPKPKKGDKQYTTYRCEIFDSRAWAWRQHDLIVLPSSVFLCSQQPITTRGSINMLLTNNQVLRFNAYSEEWTTFSSPIQTLDYYDQSARKLVKYKVKLAFACETKCGVYWEVWVLRTDHKSWEKLHKEETGNIYYDLDTNDYKTLHSYRMFTFRSDFEPTDF